MRSNQGGTNKWCPVCETIRVCAAVSPSSLGHQSGQRWYNAEHADIRWFRRGLICKTCEHQWLTAEIAEEFLDELIELRETLSEIKKNATAYARDSSRAAKTLNQLNNSLAALRALNSYDKTE